MEHAAKLRRDFGKKGRDNGLEASRNSISRVMAGHRGARGGGCAGAEAFPAGPLWDTWPLRCGRPRTGRTAIRNLGSGAAAKKGDHQPVSCGSEKKAGTGFDLAIAAADLTAYGMIPAPEETWLFLGELGLDGRIKAFWEPLPLRSGPRSWGLRGCSCQRRIWRRRP